MKKISSYITLCGMIIILLFACRKEQIQPSSSGENIFYKLPQGNHAYDPYIVQFYKDYNCVILYKFDSVDYNYNTTGAVNVGMYVGLADSAYMPPALSYLKTALIEVYPQAFLQKTLPFKILLASIIRRVESIFVWANDGTRDTIYGYPSSMAGPNYLCFGLVNDSLQKLSSQQLDSTRGVLHRAYWQQAVSNGMIERPTNFDSLTNYTYVNQNNLAQNGCFYNHNPNNGVEDFLDYIRIITSTDSTTMYQTWLSPAIDVNGLYKMKYELVKNYYIDNYGINLQTIGNMKQTN